MSVARLSNFGTRRHSLFVVRIAHSGIFLRLFVQASIQQGGVDFEVSVVVDVAPLPKLVDEMADAGARRTDHIRERLLADFRDDRLLLSILAEVRQ
jgi:hypothetical protein